MIQLRDTLAELATKYGLHPSMITNWKRQAFDNMVEGVSSKTDKAKELNEARLKDLHAKVGKLTIEPDQVHDLSIARQCELLSIIVLYTRQLARRCEICNLCV